MKSFGLFIIAAVIIFVCPLQEASSREMKEPAGLSISRGREPGQATGGRPTAAQQEKPEIRDIKAPRPPDWLSPLTMILLAALLLGLLSLGLIKKRWGRRPVLPRSAREEALSALTALESVTMGGGAYCQALSRVVRRYYENAFDLKATAMTTDEFLRALREGNHFSEEQQARFRSFLDHCDRVRFAGYEPTREEREQSLLAAREMMTDNLKKPLP